MNKEDLMSILIKRNNDYFRTTKDKSNSSYIFDPQIDTARKIIMELACNTLRTNHVMLIARMQSGKSGVCNAVVNIINKSKLYKNMCVKQFFFISGMNDCGLKDQTYSRLIEQVEGATKDNTYYSKRSKKNEKNKYFVLKNSDLMAFEGILDNSIIFIDESHYGSNEKNVLTKFLVKHGIDWRNTNELIKRNIYIVSVSATPFDELVSDTIQCKKMVELNTSEEYVGVSQYIEKDVIFEADKDDIEEDGAIFEYIMEAESRMIDNDENGIIFIRTRKFDVIMENEYVANNFDVFQMYASGSKIEYDTLNQKMQELLESNERRKALKALGVEDDTKPLIVLIKGAFRAGITISPKFKDIIYMIYDYSAKSDTTAQAMLGRMCGYRRSTENIDKTFFYLNKKFADMYSAWENNFGDRDLIPSDNSKMEWVDNSYVGEDVEFGSKSCGNFTISLSDDKIIDIYLSGKGKRNRAKIVAEYVDDILKTNGYHIDYDYIGEVHISGKNNYAKSSQIKRFDSFTEDSLVFQFRPNKIKQFMADTKRDYLTKEDLGKKCLSIVLDATIDDNLNVDGNKRLLFYYVEVGQKKMMFNRKKQYKAHKDTDLSTL